jgi:hypothetical protein
MNECWFTFCATVSELFFGNDERASRVQVYKDGEWIDYVFATCEEFDLVS